MAFKHEKSLHGTPALEREFPVENGHTVSQGDLVAFALGNGTVRGLQTNNQRVVGLCVSPGDSVGDALGTVLVRVIVDPTAVYRTPRAGLALATVQPGDLLDVNGTADGIAANVNGDLVVWEYDSIKDDVMVQCANAAFI